MCGIAGIFSYGADTGPIDVNALLRIRDHMRKRGPDGDGIWMSDDKRTGLAHRRLAIIDLSETGAQPMASSDKTYQITFNGEIYNYKELRASLQAKGYAFRTASDTEVLLHLYAEYKAEMVEHLRGMYAFGIWDVRKRELFLARDPFGIKPLYYYDDGKTFTFASQVKALTESEFGPTEPEPAGHVGFLQWGYVPEPYTLFRGLYSLPAGSTLRVDRSGPRSPKKFYDIARVLAIAESDGSGSRSQQDVHHELRESLRNSISHHLVADVPVGLFLSAGIDSTTIAAHSCDLHPGLRTLTLGFREYRGTPHDEVPLAESVAKLYGTTHSTHRISRTDFQDELPSILAAMDQPSIDGINTYLVSKAAASAGMKVALSGLGGDELFGGYASFAQIPKMVQVVAALPGARLLGPMVRRVASPLLGRSLSPKYAGVLEYGSSFGGAYLLRRGLFMPWELDDVLEPSRVREGLDKLSTINALNSTVTSISRPNLKVTALEAAWYMRSQLLRDTDWASMANSLEVRVPLLDVKLFETVATLSTSLPVSKAMLGGTPARSLPSEILSRPKTGFSVPVRDWLFSQYRGERGLRGWARTVASHFSITSLKVAALISDGFGGIGGIAKFNRDLVRSLAENKSFSSIDVYPRVIKTDLEPIPCKVNFHRKSASGKLAYLRAMVSLALSRPRIDWIICGHINLAPMAWALGRLRRCPVTLIVHGIDAWSPHRSKWVRKAISRMDRVAAVSQFTADKLRSWSGVDSDRIRILPNCVDLERFSPRPKDPELVKRYGLSGAKVILTVGRLVSKERYKGFDEVLDVLPTLISDIPNLRYLIIGDGDDQERLRSKAKSLNVQDTVVFCGFVAEEEKVKHYALADAFVMPSRGEGFGIVYLEAMACGIPTVGSLADGSREALLHGKLGALVDPADRAAIASSIRAALYQPRGIPAGLEYFSYQSFARRVTSIVPLLVP